ncbi:ABC transporter ATP-binding protein, partial [Bacillus mycoides]
MTTYKIFSLFRKDGGIAMKNPLLRIENLQTSFRIQDQYHAAVDNVS